jgi:single-strand DNA-binding protein
MTQNASENVSEEFVPAARAALKVREESERIDTDPNRILDGYFPLAGSLGKDPELKYTPSGQPVCTFNVAYEVREKDGNGDWQNLGTMWVRVNAWGQLGEHCAESLKSGSRIVAYGTWKRNKFDQTNEETGEVTKRTVFEFTAREVAASLLFNDVRILPKAKRSSSDNDF